MRDEIIANAVEQVSAAILDALARGEPPTADALRLLLRGYEATGRDDVRDAIEPALARALDLAAGSPSDASPAWLILFAEAAGVSDDPRLGEAASSLASKARLNWSPAHPLADWGRSVDACLRANVDVAGAIDELERIIAARYEPGEGVGAPADEIVMAGALLTAFSVTGRLPYAMLAEELLRHSRPAVLGSRVPFALGCDAAAVLSRMAALHHDDGYRDAAVIAPDARYEDDAAAILERLAAEAPGHGLAGAAYALAAAELGSVR